MKKSPVALGLTLLLFVGWMAYLGAQVWKNRTPPPVVSRAQLLVAKYDVVAAVRTQDDGKPAAEVTVGEQLYAADADGPKPASVITVGNLADCDGFTGPGDYVLPLVAVNGQYRIAGLPFDPGRDRDLKPRVYPASQAVRGQFAELRK